MSQIEHYLASVRHLIPLFSASGAVQEKKGLPQPLRSRDSAGLSAKFERRLLNRILRNYNLS